MINKFVFVIVMGAVFIINYIISFAVDILNPMKINLFFSNNFTDVNSKIAYQKVNEIILLVVIICLVVFLMAVIFNIFFKVSKSEKQAIHTQLINFKDVFFELKEAFVMTDKNGKIVFINTALRELAEIDELELLGSFIWEKISLRDNENNECLKNMIESVLEQDLMNIKYKGILSSKNGNKSDMNLQINTIRDIDNDLMGISFIFIPAL